MQTSVLVMGLLLASLCPHQVSAVSRTPKSWLETEGDQQAAEGCPAGVPVLTLPSNTFSTKATQAEEGIGPGKDMQLKPKTFAQAAEVSWDFDLVGNGTWSVAADGSRIWQLCVRAPGAHSLTVLFKTLSLPLYSALFLYSPAATLGQSICSVGCQRLTLHRLRQGGAILTAPTPGDTLVLEYDEAPVAQRRAARQRAPAMRMQSLLVGTSPLPLTTFADWEQYAAAANATETISQASSDLANLDPAKIADYLAQEVDDGKGSSASCQPNVECDSTWAVEANSVVLLVGASITGTGFYCTATLINAPDSQQYLIGANHCLGLYSKEQAEVWWGLVFNYESQCGSTTVSTNYQLVQGVEIVWHNEETDVMLMKLNDEIPSGYLPYFLGWNASAWTQAKGGSVCIHHPSGDTKKIAYTTNPLQQAVVSYGSDTPTHYLTSFTKGQVEEGSSGAMLIDIATRLGLGPLTGGTPTTNCRGGQDIFGSLYVAWSLGLGDYLGGAQGVNGTASMQPRRPTDDGPGLMVDPDLLVVNEGTKKGVLEIRLSEAPNSGETYTVSSSVTGNGVGAPVSAAPSKLNFTAANWDAKQLLFITPGDDAIQDGVTPFSVLLELRSSSSSKFYKRRVIPGVRLDDETPEGSTPSRAFIVAMPSSSKPFTDTGSITAGGAAPSVKLGNTTLQEFQALVPLGAAVYYALSMAKTDDLTTAACSSDTTMRLYLFSPEGIAVKSSAEDCAGDLTDPCASSEAASGSDCSGFKHLQLPGASGAYIFAVVSATQQAASYEFGVQSNTGA